MINGNEMVPSGNNTSNVVWTNVRRGNGTIGRFSFGTEKYSGMSASEIKEHLKDGGLKGKALTAKVNECLRGGKDSKALLAVAVVQTLCKDHVPDFAEKTANGAKLTFKKVGAEETADDILAKAAALLGTTVEDLKAAKAAALPAIEV